jgi:hypothetical protein
MKRWGIFALCVAVMLVFFSCSVPARAAEKLEPVTVEAVGFFSHFPMQPTRQAIEETCAKFGDRVVLTLYDEMQPEGQAFMESKSLSGHLPMRLFVGGLNTVTLDGREVSFRDFVDRAWTAADLEQAIRMALE